MITNRLAQAEIDDIFEKETDEGELAIKPYQVDCLPNDYNISVLMNLIQRGYPKFHPSNAITYGRKIWLQNLLNQ